MPDYKLIRFPCFTGLCICQKGVMTIQEPLCIFHLISDLIHCHTYWNQLTYDRRYLFLSNEMQPWWNEQTPIPNRNKTKHKQNSTQQIQLNKNDDNTNHDRHHHQQLNNRFEALEYAGLLEEARINVRNFKNNNLNEKNRKMLSRTRDNILNTMDGVRRDIRTTLNPQKVQAFVAERMEKDRSGTTGFGAGAFFGFLLWLVWVEMM